MTGFEKEAHQTQIGIMQELEKLTKEKRRANELKKIELEIRVNRSINESLILKDDAIELIQKIGKI